MDNFLTKPFRTLLMLLTFMIASSLGVTVAAATSYGFYVGGVEVTSSNCTNVTSSYIKSGHVSYDPTTNVVTLDNVLIDTEDNSAPVKGAPNRCIHNKWNVGLTIKFVGTNKLLGDDSGYAHGIRCCANTIITTDNDPSTSVEIKVYALKAAALFLSDDYYNQSSTINSVVVGFLKCRNVKFYTSYGSSIRCEKTDPNFRVSIVDCDGIEFTSGTCYEVNSETPTISSLYDLRVHNSNVKFNYINNHNYDQSDAPVFSNLSHFELVDSRLVPNNVYFDQEYHTFYYLEDGSYTPLLYNNGGVEIKRINKDGILIDEEHFPDAIFRNYLLSRPYGEDEYLMPDEIQTITAMNVSNKGIRDLTGISYFTELKYLDCSYNELSTLDVSNLTKLEELYCQFNKITSFAGESNKIKLKKLNISANYLGYDVCPLMFFYLTNLEYLNISRNNLRDDNMLYLIANLPTVSSNPKFFVKAMPTDATSTSHMIELYSAYADYEDNYITCEQVASARNKGWVPWKLQYIGESSWFAFSGDDPVAFIRNKYGDNQAWVEYSDFPDANFRSCIAQLCDRPYATVVTPDDVVNTTTLDVSGKNISDLTGIGYFTNLVTLDCSNNNLTSLDLSNNTKLRTVYCQINNLGSNMSTVISLLPTISSGTGKLYVSAAKSQNNPITTAQVNAAKAKGWRCFYKYNDIWVEYGLEGIPIDEEHFPDVVFRNYLLSMSYGEDGILTTNEISKIVSFRFGKDDYVTGPDNVDYYYDDIQDLTGIEYFTSLQELILLCECKIESLDVSSLPNLTTLTVCAPNLTELNLGVNSNLTSLSLDNAKITSLDLTNIPSLQNLYLDYVGDLELINGLTGNESLQRVKIHGSSKLTSYNFAGCTNLKYLIVKPTNDPYSKVHLDEFNVDGCSALQEMNLQFIVIESLKISSETLSVLSIVGNRISNIDLSGCSSITTLSLNNNGISSLSIAGCSGLTSLNVMYNNLSSLDVSDCTSLQELNCTSNRIKDLDLRYNTALTMVDITRNTMAGNVMQRFVDALPTVDGSTLYVKDFSWVTNSDDNVMTPEQVAIAKAKGWNVICDEGDEEYTGENGINIDEEHFPDDNFRDWLLGQEYGTDGFLTEKEMNDITSLNPADSGITDLTGISNFGNVTDVDITGNDITGEEMDQLINDLPTRPEGDGVLHVDPENITADQVIAAQEKGWTVVDDENEPTNGNPDSYIPIDTEHFPDDNFRNWLLNQEIGQDGILTDGEIAGISEFNLENVGVANPIGIGYFDQLGDVNVVGNDITGEEMSTLVIQLPYRPDNDGTIKVDAEDISADQVQSLNAKGWTVVDAEGNPVIGNPDSYIPIDAEHFPDDNLRDWLLDQPYGQDGILTDGEIAGILDLDLTDVGVVDPTGIGYFDQLDNINVVGNDITGEEMDQLINDLPTRTDGDGVLHVDADNISADQVAAAQEKGWTVVDAEGNPTEGVPSYTRGDVNGDGEVDVVDVTAVVNYINNGEATGTFIFNAADCNGDGEIDVVDITAIVNIINGSAAGAPRMNAPSLIINSDNVSAAAFDISAGESKSVELSLSSMRNYTAFQMDVTLPEGISVASVTLNSDRCADSHVVTVTERNGVARILVYSLDNADIATGDGALLSLNLVADNNVSVGAMKVDNITFATSDEQGYHFDSLTVPVGTSGIDAVNGNVNGVTVKNGRLVIESARGGDATITTINGQSRRVNVEAGVNELDLDHGVYIITVDGQSTKVRL